MGGARDGEKFPSWIPRELVLYIRSGLAYWRTQPYWVANRRLLNDERMKSVWARFEELPEDQRKPKMTQFFEVVSTAYLDGEERKLSSFEQKKIKAFKRKILNESAKLIRSVKEIDRFCSKFGATELLSRSEMDGENSRERQIQKITENATRQLSFYRANTLPRVHFFVPRIDLEELLTLKKRGQSNFAEVFTREVVSMLFKQLFGQPLSAEAAVVAQVIAGVATPKNATRTHLRDQTRKRRSNLRRRRKKT